MVSTYPAAQSLDEKHMPLCRGRELSNLWRLGGFESVCEQSIEIRMKFESFADYWDPFLLGQGPAGSYVRRLERNKLQALRDAVQRVLSLSAENTPFVLSAWIWSVRGIVPNQR